MKHLLSITGLLLLVHSGTAYCNECYKDWVPTQEGICHGHYLPKTAPFPTSSLNTGSQPISATADHATFVTEGQSVLSGHVHVQQGNQDLYADKAVIHRDPHQSQPIQKIEAYQNILLTDPDFRLEGSTLTLWVPKNQQTVENARYRFYPRHARGQAKSATLTDRERLKLNKATYTTCAPYQDIWDLQAKELDLNQITGRGQAYHSVLYVKKIPVFYLPYVNFPIDNRRQTGFLFPDIGINNQTGLQIKLPFYWNLAPHYDATITPLWYGRRGLGLMAEFRYLHETGHSEIQTNFFANDRTYKRFRTQHLEQHPGFTSSDPRVLALNKNSHREALKVTSQLQAQRLSNTLDYQWVRDDNYFNDFGTDLGMASTNQLLQQWQSTLNTSGGHTSLRLSQYQTLHAFLGPQTTNQYKRLPQISFQQEQELRSMELMLKGDFTHFLYNQMPGDPFKTTGNRFQLRPSLSWPLLRSWGYVKPRVQWNWVVYDLKRSQDHHVSSQIPIIDLETGLLFERSLQDNIQTLEPKLYYLWVPYRNQNRLPIFDTSYPGFGVNQLYWDNRFTGLDRLGDANQMTASLTTRLLDQKQGFEKLSATLGQIVYFKKQRVTTCSIDSPSCQEQPYPHRLSPIIGLIRYAPSILWRLQYTTQWDLKAKRFNENSIALNYLPDANSVFNVGYQSYRQDYRIPPRTEQTDLSFAWQFHDQTRLLGKWHYDLKRHRSNEIDLGIERENCCTAIRLVVSRFLKPYDIVQTKPRYTQGVFIQFVFKGFAGVGHPLPQMLSKRIPNYPRWSEDRF